MDDQHQDPEPRYAFEMRPDRGRDWFRQLAICIGFPGSTTERRQAANPTNDPTPAQIAAECAEIQAGWNSREELSRRAANCRRVPFVVPGAEMFGEVVARSNQ